MAQWTGSWSRQERYSQPVMPLAVPPPQVRLRVPVEVTLQAPLQVILQVPAEQTTLLPAPTVWVQDLPLQLTLQSAPQVPEQVAVEPQAKLQPLVEAVQASKVQLSAAGQVQAVPEQTESVQAALSRTAMEAKYSLRFMESSRPDSPTPGGQ